MRILHLVKIRFDRRAPKITTEWLRKRFEFFFNHTYKSLCFQTNQDWVLWINCQSGMEEVIGQLGVRNQLPLEKTILSFGDSAPKVSGTYDYIYVTRLDSDDLYAPDALEIVRNHKPSPSSSLSPEALVFRKGYLHRLSDGKTGIYYNPSSPFHTLLIPFKVWSSEDEYSRLWKRVGDHSRVTKELPHHILPDMKFTVLIHDDNFISDFNYSRVPGVVEKDWSEKRFLSTQPVIFDVDDFCDELRGKECLGCLRELKFTYPNFKCTLFGIPGKTTEALLEKVRNLDWVELALHGYSHYPTEELKQVSPTDLYELYSSSQRVKNPIYVKGFRPPGWYITKEHIQVLNHLGMWVALHKRDKDELGKYCHHGFYICDDPSLYWHGHTHDTCGNWIEKHLPTLLKKWPEDQKFGFVSEALMTYSAD